MIDSNLEEEKKKAKEIREEKSEIEESNEWEKENSVEKIRKVYWEEELCEENGYKLTLERVEFSKEETDIIPLEMVEAEPVLEVDKEKVGVIIKDFVVDYARNKDKQKTEEWLKDKLASELPGKSSREIEIIRSELITGVEEAEERLRQVKEKKKLGLSESDILAREIEKNAIGEDLGSVKEELREISNNLTSQNEATIYKIAGEQSAILGGGVTAFNKLNTYFDNINQTIAENNALMQETLLNKTGMINQNPNLDGFIFEQFHAGTFNLETALKDIAGVKAEALVPKPGAVYTKNSVDMVVKVNGKVVQKYQAKCSSNPEKLFQKGNYKFQRRLFNAESGEYTVIEYGGVKSTSLSKIEVKEMQVEVQSKKNLEVGKQSFKNDVDIKIISKQMAKQSMTAGFMGLGVGMTLSAGSKILSGEEVEIGEVVADGLKAGAGSGLSVAVSGGLRVAIEREAIRGTGAKLLMKNNVIGTIGFSAVAMVSTMAAVGSGELSIGEGFKAIGDILVSTYAGMAAHAAGIAAVSGSTIGATLGVTLGTVGVILTPVVAVTAGVICAVAGSKVASAIYNGAAAVVKGVAKTAVGIVKAGASVVKSVASGIGNTIKSVGSAIGNGIKSIGSAIGSFFGW